MHFCSFTSSCSTCAVLSAQYPEKSLLRHQLLFERTCEPRRVVPKIRLRSFSVVTVTAPNLSLFVVLNAQIGLCYVMKHVLSRVMKTRVCRQVVMQKHTAFKMPTPAFYC